MRSPLEVRLCISRRAIDLAGGAEVMNNLFAARLRGFLEARGEMFDVWSSDIFTCATGDDDGRRMFVMSNSAQRFWGETEGPIEYCFEGFDVARGIIPVTGSDCVRPNDSFWLLFAALRDLVVEWPEVVSVTGADDLPRQFPPIVDANI